SCCLRLVTAAAQGWPIGLRPDRILPPECGGPSRRYFRTNAGNVARGRTGIDRHDQASDLRRAIAAEKYGRLGDIDTRPPTLERLVVHADRLDSGCEPLELFGSRARFVVQTDAGRDVSWADHVAADHMRAERYRDRLREVVHSGLGRAIGEHSGIRLGAG